MPSRTGHALRRAAIVLSLALAGARLVAAEPAAGDGQARMERIAEGVYAILHDDAATEWPHGNTGVIVGDDGVLVVDATYLPSRARADIALIRTITDKPVRYLVNTHWHFDHNNGNVAYRDAFPGIAIVSQRANREYIELNSTRWARNASASGSPQRKALAELEKRLAGGTDVSGRPLSSEARAAEEAGVRKRRGELDELASLQVVPPNVLFDGELTLFLGTRRVDIRAWGRANSPEDVTVYLPADRVLFTGDILVHPVPYTYYAWPVEWIDVLRRIEALPVAAVVPGHGPVMRDHAYTRRVRELLEGVTARVAAMAKQGMSLDQIKSSIDLEDLRNGFVHGDDANAKELWDDSIKGALIERAWLGVRGQV